MAETTLNILGIQTRVRDSGGTGPVLLLSSGIGHSLEFWGPQFAHLTQDYRLIAWDYPAHGLSEVGPSNYTVTSLAAHALALLDALGVSTATFIGNSLGGAVSVQAYALAPDRIDRIVLVAPALHGPEVFAPFKLFALPILGKLMTKPSEASVDRQIAGIFHPSFEVPPDLKETIRRNVFKEGVGPQFLNLMKSTVSLRGIKPAVYGEMRRILKTVACPVLFVHGQDDQILPYHQSLENAERIGNSQVEILETCGHVPQLEKSNKFNDLICNFVPVALPLA